MKGNKPQEDPHWRRSTSDMFPSSVWVRDEELDLYVERKHHRWGWVVKRHGVERVIGSSPVRYSYPELCFEAIYNWLEKEREGYEYVPE